MTRSPFPTGEHKRIIQSILSVIETGDPGGDYGALIVLRDGAGFSYGKHQATDGGGALDRIGFAYLDAGGLLADELAPQMSYLVNDATTQLAPGKLLPGADGPAWALRLADTLRRAAEDPIMQAVQDRIFDTEYWEPAVRQAAELGIALPLSMLTVYDTAIQSGFTRSGRLSRMRARFPEVPPARGGDERAWTLAYLKARRGWLAGSGTEAVRASVYRIDVYLALAEADRWDLAPPFPLPPQFPRITIQ